MDELTRGQGGIGGISEGEVAPMDKLPEAGRELDALIAEEVMGVTSDFPASQIPRYSTEIFPAWFVVSRMHAETNPLSLSYQRAADVERPYDFVWVAEFRRRGGVCATADTAPLAICRAALAAVRAGDARGR